MELKPVRSALVSVFHKEGLEPLIAFFKSHQTKLYSTGGTKTFLEEAGLSVEAVEDLTKFPEVFGGRVKTLHPKVFGGILNRREESQDQSEKEAHAIPDIDLVVVDLYPFEKTVASGAEEAEVIEKIDIGGIALIRAAAKNHRDVACISNAAQYEKVADWLMQADGHTSLAQRKELAAEAFAVSSHYDTHIFNYLNQAVGHQALRISSDTPQALRYGENPHQNGMFYGKLPEVMEQLHGKELSYNNLVDAEACIAALADIHAAYPDAQANCVIIKHTNACGWAFGSSAADAYRRALAADPVSAFGGIIGLNRPIDLETAQELDGLFFELLIAPGFDDKALKLLQTKKNRRLLRLKQFPKARLQFRSMLDGVLVQDIDLTLDKAADLQTKTALAPSAQQTADLLFASLLAKNAKSNTIVLVREGQLLASGVGQTSRIDAARQAIAKAEKFGFDPSGAVMASDAFFPFPDTVEIAAEAGIAAIVQPGGSVKDDEVIAMADRHGIAMVFTGRRHFKH